MHYKLKSGEKLSNGIRRVARKQMGRAGELLRESAGAQGGSIHEARQWLKKARATLQLVRPALGDKVCRREDGKLRKIARRLARRRDAEVLVTTLETLRSGRRELAEDRAWEKLQQIFLKRREASVESLPDLQKFRGELRELRARVNDWPLKKLHASDLRRGLGRVYRDGRKAMQRSEKTRTTEDFHAWRKRVKELWHGLRILEPELPAAMAGFAPGLKELGEHLGNEHDLAVLEAALATCKLDTDELKVVKKRVQLRRAALQQTALKQGRRLFAKDAGTFVK